jgi:hypothetical protein
MQPGLVTPKRVNPRHFVDGQTIVDVVPIVRCGVGRVDAERLDGINNLQHAFDLRPTGQPQQDVAARPYIGHGCAALAGRDSPQNIDARDDCTEIVGGPAYEREDATWRKRKNAAPLIENLFLGGVAEAYPVLDALLEPKELNMWVRSLMPSPFCGGRLSSLNAFELRRVRRLTAGVPVEERGGYDAERERLSVIPRGEKRVVR